MAPLWRITREHYRDRYTCRYTCRYRDRCRDRCRYRATEADTHADSDRESEQQMQIQTQMRMLIQMQTQTPMPRQMSDARHLTTYTRYWIRHTGLDPLFRPRDLDTYADTDPDADTDTDTALVHAPCVLILMTCLLYTSPSPRDLSTSRMPSSA